MINAFQTQSTAYANTEECPLLTPPELATYLGIGRNTAYELLNKGIIKGFRIGTQWKVSKKAVDLYIAQSSGLLGYIDGQYCP